MIELPRAALTADQIATVADFVSFGTNDLTQTTFGFSRDACSFDFRKALARCGGNSHVRKDQEKKEMRKISSGMTIKRAMKT